MILRSVEVERPQISPDYGLPFHRDWPKHKRTMKPLPANLTLPLLLVLGCSLPSLTLRAEPRTFTIDQAQSTLTISGSFAGVTIQQQGPGSLTTRYTGNLETDLTDTAITFVGGSAITALTNGNWQPAPGGEAGSAPANYGGQVVIIFVINGKAAVREVVLDLTSGPLALVNGEFASQGLEFTFPPTVATRFDYNYSGLAGTGSGSQPLTGTSTNMMSTNATLRVQGEELVLTIPVDISGSASAINPDDLQYQLRGQLVARASMPVPLRIASFEWSAGQLEFNLDTTPGRSYSILASSDFTDWSTVIDQFTATNTSSVRTIALPDPPPQQFFRVRQD